MLLKEGKYFLILTCFYLIVSVFLLVLYTKPEIAIAVNSFNCAFCDVFFKYITHAGTGYLLIPVFIILLIQKKKKEVIVTVLSSLIMFLLVSGLKRIIYTQRPSKFFKETFITDYQFHFVEGVKLHGVHSFPSGHTAAAFLTFFLIAVFFAENKVFWQIVMFLAAFFVAYSRMYLFQHFLIDIFAGAIFGVFSVMISNFIVSKKIKNI